MRYTFKKLSRLLVALAMVATLSFGGVVAISSTASASTSNEGSDELPVNPAREVTAKPVTFTQPTCDKSGTYTIPRVEWPEDFVQYKKDGEIIKAGTYNAQNDSTVTITASIDPIITEDQFHLVGTTEWTNTFTQPEDCTPTVAPTSTPPQVTSTPVGAVDAGAGSALTAVAGLLGSIVLVGAGAYLRKSSFQN